MIVSTYRNDTLRIAHVNTPRIATTCSGSEMDDKDLMAERLRDARSKAGYPSAQAAAEAFGWEPGAYRHHENGTRKFDIPTAKRYGRAFKVNPGWLLTLDGTATNKDTEVDLVEYQLTGKVAAGEWTEGFEITEDEQIMLPLPPPTIKGIKRFLLLTEGLSMDLVYPPGTVLDCWSIFDLQMPPENGDDVIVERRRADGMREFTVKRFHRDADGRNWLMPQSSRPDFQTPIEIGEPSYEENTDAGVQVIAFVYDSYNEQQIKFMQRLHRARKVPVFKGSANRLNRPH